MSKKIIDFLSSFGIMLAGIFLLFFSSVYFVSGNNFFPKESSGADFQFPNSDKRIEAGGDAYSGEISQGGNLIKTELSRDIYSKSLPASKPAVPLAKDSDEFSGSSTAVSAVAVDTKTRNILFSENPNEPRPLASITKLMTAMVLLDLPINWYSTIEIIGADVDTDHHVKIGEKFTLEDLWNAALVGSSNASVRALVRGTGLGNDEFVSRMNEKAKELKLFSARFVEPTGLSDKNMANAMDTAKLLIDALKFDKIYTAAQTGEYYLRPLGGGKPRRVWTTNWLLTNWIPNNFKMEDIAGKTGYIDNSGYNFAVSLNDEKKHGITVVILGAATNENRFSEARDLAQWVFGHYLWPDEPGYDDLLK